MVETMTRQRSAKRSSSASPQERLSAGSAGKKRHSAKAAAKPAANGKPTEQAGGTVRLKLSDIATHPKNPRSGFDDREQARLLISMQEDDLLQPIIVRAAPAGCEATYQLVAGERRLRVAKVIGWETIPACVRKLSDVATLRLMGSENINRLDLNDIERGRYLRTLSDSIKDGGAGMTNDQIADTFGHSASWVKNLKRLVELPEPWQQRVVSRQITGTAARHLLPYKDRPDVLEAVSEDIKAHPFDWRTCEDFETNLPLVAAQVENGHAEDVLDVDTRAAGQPCDDVDRVSTEPTALEPRQNGRGDPLSSDLSAPAAEAVTVAGRPLASVARRGPTRAGLSEDQAMRLLAPYAKHKADLQTIRRAAAAILDRLKKPSASPKL